MSKIVENAALYYCAKNNIEGFTSRDISRLHDIYDLASKEKYFKPLKNTHPKNILRRIRNAMKTGYYFERIVTKVGGRKVSFYRKKTR